MKISEVKSQGLGKCFDRISLAFKQHFPRNVEWGSPNPDIKIFYLFGGYEIEQLLKQDDLSNVVIFQVNYFTTAYPLEKFVELWKRAKLVISFHPLDTYFPNEKFNFYRTALGAEPSVFTISNANRHHKVFTTGHVANTECLDKIFDACSISNTKMLHTGENFKWNPQYYTYLPYMSDAEFVNKLQTTQYIAGLRLLEGFEMMCIEGAMTGATPIVPQLPTYDFYKDFGIFIDTNKNITEQLVEIFRGEYKQLSREKVEYVRDTFSWTTVCNGLYNRITE